MLCDLFWHCAITNLLVLILSIIIAYPQGLGFVQDSIKNNGIIFLQIKFLIRILYDSDIEKNFGKFF